jgi:hypothetical protein
MTNQTTAPAASITVRVTAMKYPGFFATRKFEGATIEDVIANARLHDWSHDSFETASEWPPVQSLLLETDDEERLVDLEPSGVDAIAVLREFVEDIKLAHGTGEGDAIDGAGLDWPDLAATYHKAVVVLDCRLAEAVSAKRTVYTAIYEHNYGTDVRVFRTEAQAVTWRNEVASEWWDNEFPEDERPPEEEIGSRYFDRMRDGGDEFFSIEAHVVE